MFIFLFMWDKKKHFISRQESSHHGVAWQNAVSSARTEKDKKKAVRMALQ